MKNIEPIKDYHIKLIYKEKEHQIESVFPSSINSYDLMDEFFKFMLAVGYTDETIDETLKYIAQDLNQSDLPNNVTRFPGA